MAAIAAVAIVLLAACGGSSGNKDASSPGASVAESSREEAGAEDAEAVTAGAGLPERGGQPADIVQQVVYTGSLTVRVEDRPKASDEVIAIAEARGGRLFSQQADLGSDGETTLVVKVAPDEFSEAMGELAELGDTRRREVDSEDVTDQVVDLEGRLETATRSADRLRELLVDAADVNAIVAVEQELARREAEIESIQGQLRLVESRAELATITITLTTEDEPAVNKDIPGFGTGLSNGLVAVVNVLAVALTILGFSLPFLALLVPLVLAWRFWRRRHPKQRSKPTVSAPPPGMTWDGIQWRPFTQQTPVPQPAAGPQPQEPVDETTTPSGEGGDASNSA